jgi:sugar phosphate isomerase/epimerase
MNEHQPSVSRGRDDTEEKARARCIEATQEACDHAARYGIIFSLENHGGIVTTIDQMLSVVQAVKHDWFGVNFATGNFRSADPYTDLERLAPYAVVTQIKTEIHPTGRDKEDADLKRLLDMLRNTGYRGYVALEYEVAEDPHTAVPRHLDRLKKLVR